MANEINPNLLKNFIIKNVGTKMTANEAQKLGLENEFHNIKEDLDVNMLDIDDILDNENLYEQFATMYVEEKEQKTAVKDKEQEKEEQTAIKDKNDAGV